MQSFSLAISLLLSVAARQGQASCAYGTSLHKRVEGQVPVNTFGYAGAIVRNPFPPRQRRTYTRRGGGREG